MNSTFLPAIFGNLRILQFKHWQKQASKPEFFISKHPKMKGKNYAIVFSLGILICSIVASCQLENKEERNNEEAIREEVSALPVSFVSPADNPATPEKIELGRLLFYDPILSGQKDVACASCHHPEYGYAESQELSIGVNGIGLGELRKFKSPGDIPFSKRNAHTVLNTAFNGIDVAGEYRPSEAPMFWDLRVKSLENQSLEPIRTFEEMRGHAFEAPLAIDSIVNRLRAIPVYQQLFRAAFGEPESIQSVNLGKALAAFERSLVANNARFDQYMRGDKEALSAMELEGYEAFIKTGCAKCHNGPMFSDFKLHVMGVPDNEKLAQSDAGANKQYAFRTPSLRNLRYTDPYMHSGKFKTLENVMEFYEDLAGKDLSNPHVSRAQLDPLARELNVNFKDIRIIIEILNSLNDDAFDRKIPDRVPSGLPVGGDIAR
jgi:cytochrome c peroxidase